MALTHHSHQHHQTNKLSRLKICLILTAVGMLIEVVGGLLSNSLSLLSDAGHMLTDAFALGMSYFAVLLALKPASKRHTYGFFRAEVLAAFVNSLALIFIAGFIAYEAFGRLSHPAVIKINEMLFIALVGLAINGISISFLSKVGSGDLNVRSAILHQLGDMISSIAVVAGAIVIYFTHHYIIDSLLSFFICALIISGALRLLLDSAHILLESTPKHLDIDEVIKTVKSEVPGVHEMHHVHIWTISTSMYALTAHVVVEDCKVSAAREFLHKINDVLKKNFAIEHTNLQFECIVRKI
jgi:cobalt-zinc-cadmium efflux system protein